MNSRPRRKQATVDRCWRELRRLRLLGLPLDEARRLSGLSRQQYHARVRRLKADFALFFGA